MSDVKHTFSHAMIAANSWNRIDQNEIDHQLPAAIVLNALSLMNKKRRSMHRDRKNKLIFETVEMLNGGAAQSVGADFHVSIVEFKPVLDDSFKLPTPETMISIDDTTVAYFVEQNTYLSVFAIVMSPFRERYYEFTQYGHRLTEQGRCINGLNPFSLTGEVMCTKIDISKLFGENEETVAALYERVTGDHYRSIFPDTRDKPTVYGSHPSLETTAFARWMIWAVEFMIANRMSIGAALHNAGLKYELSIDNHLRVMLSDSIDLEITLQCRKRPTTKIRFIYRNGDKERVTYSFFYNQLGEYLSARTSQ